MSEGSDTLIDKDGIVYEKGWDGQYHPRQGLFGPVRDTDWFGQPRVKCDWFGNPEEARDWLGGPVRSSDGETLYRRPGSGGGSGGWGVGGGDAAAAALGLLLSIGLAVLLVYAIGAVLSLLAQLLAALYNGWRGLVQRYPRGMLVVHLLIGMAAVGYGLYLAGFNLELQLGGAALVPALWGWLWLTRRLPIIFMPINAVLVGGGLWLVAQATQVIWSPTWSRLTADLPFVGNLPVLLTILPITLWFWGLGVHRWPKIFRLLNLLVAGALLWFLLMRAWTTWQPLWRAWVEPIPLLPSVTGWLIFLLPMGLWLWYKAQTHWPLPFTALNLLIFGGLLGLTAYHTQSVWYGTWRHWMTGLPFAAAPILTIILSPVTLWGWSKASHHWPRVFAIPNLLLTGGILWLVMDRTRSLWADAWQTAWGEVPLRVDPTLLLLVLPLAIWAWRQGNRRWPHYWGAARAILWGGILWWIAERTRSGWQVAWWAFVGPSAPDLVWLAGLMPLLVWIWFRLRGRWPRALRVFNWVILTATLGWIVGRLLPASTLALRAGVAFLPLTTWGWLWLLRHHPRVGWPLTLLPPVGLGLLARLAPDHFQALLSTLVIWLARQGLSIG